MSFTLIRYRIHRDAVRLLPDDSEVHMVATMRLYRTEEEAWTVADRLNEVYLPAGGPWFVDPVYIAMTEEEHTEYESYERWSE